MNTFNYFYGVTILQLVLRPSGNLSKTHQKSSLTSCQGKRILQKYFDTADNKFTPIRR